MSVFNVAVVSIGTHPLLRVVSPGFFLPKGVMRGEASAEPRSAFILDLSDRWNQTTGGFVLVDLVGHVSAHGLDLNVPGVGVVRFICKPFLFWRKTGREGKKRRQS